jgi:hypothetical protein
MDWPTQGQQNKTARKRRSPETLDSNKPRIGGKLLRLLLGRGIKMTVVAGSNRGEVLSTFRR